VERRGGHRPTLGQGPAKGNAVFLPRVGRIRARSAREHASQR
jgi:hypothetical protein